MLNKSRLRTDPLLIIFLFILFGGGALLRFTGDKAQAPLPQVAAQAAELAHGHLVFEHGFFDFGTLTEGDIVKHTFKFKNEGAGKVKIVKTDSSCGCTSTSAELKEYAPGESGELEVEVDTKGKKGIVVKTVTVTLENNEVATAELSLAMKLEPPPHPKIGSLRNININADAACKSCHLESGEGQSGIFLFHRVCSQCHGKKGVGGFAHALNDTVQQKANDARIKNVIRAGMLDKGMPSFVEGVTPPLSEEQVDSLVQYIRGLVQR